MIVIEFDRIELDYCLACNGIWFDSGELELLLGSIDLNKIMEEVYIKEKKLRCPICKRQMHKVKFSQSQSTNIKSLATPDSCRFGHGIWLDKNEIQMLLSGESKSRQLKLEEFLKKVFDKRGD